MNRCRIWKKAASAVAASAVACFGVTPNVAADGLGEKADAYLAEKVAEHELVGAAAAISVNGEIVWTGGAGYRDLEAELPFEGNTVHRIASITKSMTATAVMQLVEDGKIDLNDALQMHLPTFPKNERGTVRIRHLLTHTSGMRHYLGRENRPFTYYPTLTDAVAVFQDRGLAFVPGDRYLYTTYGYTTLGAVIETASGKTYEDYMREHIWDPAGMTSTQLEDRGRDLPERTRLYRRERDGTIVEDDQTDLSIKYPGGGLLSTAGDLVRFAAAFENGALLAPETRERMFLVPEIANERARKNHPPYALGWIVGDSERFGRYIRNDGGQAGTSTNLLVLRERGIAVAVVANVARAGAEVGSMTNDLAAIAAGLD